MRGLVVKKNVDWGEGGGRDLVMKNRRGWGAKMHPTLKVTTNGSLLYF